jgi:2-oxoglutarate dehydrogenase complex dehydrogenase (E1) component-like enzyme
MAAWSYMAMELKDLNLIGVSRNASAATAEGSHDLHKRRLAKLFDDLFAYASVKKKVKA